MNTSSDFRISSILLMAATIACVGLAVAILVPRLTLTHQMAPGPAAMDDTRTHEADRDPGRYSEFVPSHATTTTDTVQRPMYEPQASQVGEVRNEEQYAAGVQPSPISEQLADSTPGAAKMQPAVQNFERDPFVDYPEPDSGSRQSTADLSTADDTTPWPDSTVAATDHNLLASVDSSASAPAEPQHTLPSANDGDSVTAEFHLPQAAIAEAARHGVYVPVTVNIDNSALSTELTRFNERLDQLLTEKLAASDHDEKPRRSKEERSQRKKEASASELRIQQNAQTLSQLDRSLAELNGSLKQFQHETNAAIGNLSAQVRTSQSEAQLLETLRMVLAERNANSAGHAHIAESPAEVRVSQVPADSNDEPLAPQFDFTVQDSEPQAVPTPPKSTGGFEDDSTIREEQPVDNSTKSEVPVDPFERPSSMMFFRGSGEANSEDESSMKPNPPMLSIPADDDCVSNGNPAVHDTVEEFVIETRQSSRHSISVLPATPDLSAEALQPVPVQPQVQEARDSNINNPFPPTAVEIEAAGIIDAHPAVELPVADNGLPADSDVAEVDTIEIVDPVVFQHTYSFPVTTELPEGNTTQFRTHTHTGATGSGMVAGHGGSGHSGHHSPRIRKIEDSSLNPLQKGMRAIKSSRWVPDVDMPQWANKLPDASPVKAVRESQWLHRLSSSIRRAPASRTVD